MQSLDPATRALVIRGAKIGALSTGFVAFCAGVGLCIAYRLPVPPIAVTELGVLVGGVLGAAAGFLWRQKAGRGLVLGLLLGLLIAWPAAYLAPAGMRLLAWFAALAMAGVLGYQAASAPEAGKRSPWRLHR